MQLLHIMPQFNSSAKVFNIIDDLPKVIYSVVCIMVYMAVFGPQLNILSTVDLTKLIINLGTWVLIKYAGDFQL